VRLNAWTELIDRGHGKPTTPIEVEAETELQSVTIHIPGLDKDWRRMSHVHSRSKTWNEEAR
jgi:hypothetical protein